MHFIYGITFAMSVQTRYCKISVSIMTKSQNNQWHCFPNCERKMPDDKEIAWKSVMYQNSCSHWHRGFKIPLSYLIWINSWNQSACREITDIKILSISILYDRVRMMYWLIMYMKVTLQSCRYETDRTPASSDDYHLFPILQSRSGCRNAEIEHGRSRRDLLQILSNSRASILIV